MMMEQQEHNYDYDGEAFYASLNQWIQEEHDQLLEEVRKNHGDKVAETLMNGFCPDMTLMEHEDVREYLVFVTQQADDDDRYSESTNSRIAMDEVASAPTTVVDP